jgi:hypothetical protein
VVAVVVVHFGLLTPSVPHGIDPRIHTRVPPKPVAPPHEGSGGVFSSSAIVATKPKIVLHEFKLIYYGSASKLSTNTQ